MTSLALMILGFNIGVGMRLFYSLPLLFLVGCGDPCKPKEGCIRSHVEKRLRNSSKCIRSHEEYKYHSKMVWHFFKPHWRRERVRDKNPTTVCDEYEQEEYEVTVCDEYGILRDALERPIPEDYEGCEKKRRGG